MDIAIEKILILQMLTFLAASLSLVAVMHGRTYRGLRFWVQGLLLTASAVGLTVFSHLIPEMFWIPLINAALAGSYSFLIAAILEFRKKQINHALLAIPVVLVIIIYTINGNNPTIRFILTSLTYFVQNLAIIALLLRKGEDRVNFRGKYLILLGSSFQAVAYGARILYGYKGQMIPYSMVDATQLQIFTVLSLQVTVILISFGFLFMVIEASEAEIHRLLKTDNLTGLWNRRMADELGQNAWQKHASTADKPLSLILMDIDHFKGINDSCGHIAGDTILREFGDANKRALRPTDAICRWGGEEFIVILPHTLEEEARELAERLRKNTESMRYSHNMSVTASYGYTACGIDEDWTQCVQRADQALYLAKNSGRNRVVGLSRDSVDIPVALATPD
jgi:diguanylate cyclase (GGDEF)-like protein